MVHLDSGSVLAEEVELMDSFWSRFRGLMFRRNFEPGRALLFKFSGARRFRIHTFFVFFPIDLIYLDEGFRVVDVEGGLSPWSTYCPEHEGNFLVELPGGTTEGVGVELGDELELRLGESP